LIDHTAYIINRRVKFIEFEETIPSKDDDPEIWPAYKPETKFGFCVGLREYYGRYPEHPMDFEIVAYDIEKDDGSVVSIIEDDVIFLGWKRLN
jgi:hypothetical protein